MPFDSLSTDILLEILSLATRVDLKNLSPCSRRLYNITQPLLYESIRQTGIEAIPSIIRSIVGKPHLAGYIKHLDLTLLTQQEEKIDIDISTTSPQYRAFVLSQLRDRLAPYTEYDTSGIYNRIMSSKDNWVALAALLLILSGANLESITLRCQDYQPTYIHSILDLTATSERPYFPKLRRVTLMPHPKFARLFGGNSCFNTLLSHALRICHLPELHLRFLFSPCLARFVTDETGSRDIFTIKVLSITDSHLTPDCLKNTLSQFNSLTHFKYQHAKTAVNACDVNPRMIEQGLYKSRHSLEKLILEEADVVDPFRFRTIYHPFRKLGDFNNLRVLEVQALRFLGPESIGHNKIPPPLYGRTVYGFYKSPAFIIGASKTLGLSALYVRTH